MSIPLNRHSSHPPVIIRFFFNEKFSKRAEMAGLLDRLLVDSAGIFTGPRRKSIWPHQKLFKSYKSFSLRRTCTLKCSQTFIISTLYTLRTTQNPFLRSSRRQKSISGHFLLIYSNDYRLAGRDPSCIDF